MACVPLVHELPETSSPPNERSCSDHQTSGLDYCAPKIVLAVDPWVLWTRGILMVLLFNIPMGGLPRLR